MGYCSICGEEKDVRHHDIYVHGSEGIELCHECEMFVVGFIRSTVWMMTRKAKRKE